MRYRPAKTRLEKMIHKICLLTVLLTSYFIENTSLTSASSFEVATKKKYTRRMPANMSQQTFEFNCSKPHDFLEMSTQFETIRLVTKNCLQKPELLNTRLNQRLLTFETADHQFSSEYAYLAIGENSFEILFNDKVYKVLIIRY
jgi:hypothetical protein